MLLPFLGHFILLICVGMICAAAYFIHMNSKNMTANLYAKLHEHDKFGDKTPSPYKARYRRHSSKDLWGYTITKEGHEMTNYGKVEFFESAKECQAKIHELELMGNYIRTKFDE